MLMIPWLPNCSGRFNPYEIVFLPLYARQKVFWFVFLQAGIKFPKFQGNWFPIQVYSSRYEAGNVHPFLACHSISQCGADNPRCEIDNSDHLDFQSYSRDTGLIARDASQAEVDSLISLFLASFFLAKTSLTNIPQT